jgi:signal peptidase I
MSETSTFEEIIEKDGYLVYTCKGFSMMPLLRQHRDLVVISKITEPLKKYDVILTSP